MTGSKRESHSITAVSAEISWKAIETVAGQQATPFL
jgi:hypothetical protein